ncbi:MAG: hypothetical protein VB857_02105 [Pirellulaceae bacterium]
MKKPSHPLDKQLPILKIIVGSLIGAVIMFMVMAVVLFPFGKGDVPGGKAVLISYVALGLSGLVLLVIRPLVVTAIIRSATRTTQVDQTGAEKHLLQTFQHCTFVEHAMLEAMCFLNLASYVAERQIWSLLVSTAIILWMVFRFPSRDRAQRWLENHAGDENRR